jgi:thiamine biosynthesis lipoprotein
VKSRRDFLRSGKPAPEPRDFQVLRLGRPAMATRFEILFPTVFRSLVEAGHRALDEVRRLESMLSYFNPSSTVSELNRDAAYRPVVVESELFELLERSCRIWEETGGAFDVAAGAIWSCWGFHRREGHVPDRTEIQAALANTGSDGLELCREQRSVRFRKPGLQVNLGSIGKGFALDRSASLLQNAGFEQALLHAGNSSFLAWGDPASSGAGWRVSVRHPLDRNSDLVELGLRETGMAASGLGEQYFEVEGRRYGHILDPRRGMPVHHHLSVMAFAPDAAWADALSTAFFVMDAEEIGRYCDDHAGIGAIVVPAQAQGTRLQVLTFGNAESFLGKVILD